MYVRMQAHKHTSGQALVKPGAGGGTRVSRAQGQLEHELYAQRLQVDSI